MTLLFVISNIMAFLTISSLFDKTPKQESKGAITLHQARARIGASGEKPPELTWPQIDRRVSDERRASDRREKQHATFLETRKIQGRRRTSGRRQSDGAGSVSPFYISVKG